METARSTGIEALFILVVVGVLLVAALGTAVSEGSITLPRPANPEVPGAPPKLWNVNVPEGADTTVALPAINQHARDRHGEEAQMAADIVAQRGKFHRWQCRDGRDRYMVPAGMGRWAFVVVQGYNFITSFMTTDAEYIAGEQNSDRCRGTNPFAFQ